MRKSRPKNSIPISKACPNSCERRPAVRLKRQMADQIVRVKLLSQQARKEGLDQDPATKARIAFQVENLSGRRGL